MKILITGLGSHVATYLARTYARDGHQITATYLTRKPEGLTATDGIRVIKVDLANGPLNLEPADVVIHAAARTAWTSNPASEYIRSNVVATKNLAEYGKITQPKVFFYFSSIAIHGDIDAAELCEDTVITSPNMYGLSKYMGEKLIEERATDFPSVAIRLPGIIGPGYFAPIVGRILSQATANETIPIYNPDSMFNAVTDFEDVKAFISHVFESAYDGHRVVNLAGSEPMKLKDLVENITSRVGSTSSISEQPSSQRPFCINTERIIQEFEFQPSATRTIIERFVDDNKLLLTTDGGNTSPELN